MEPQFLAFVELFGVSLTATNLQIYSDLYENFKTFPTLSSDSFERRFILWKNHNDQLATTSRVINKPPPQNEMIPNNNHLPFKLQKIADDVMSTATFTNFTLKPEKAIETETVCLASSSGYEMCENVVQELATIHDTNLAAEGIIQLAYDTTEQPQTPQTQQPTRGKNIATLKAQYDGRDNNSSDSGEQTAISAFTTNRKKRKRAPKVTGSGRPTRDQSMIRVANNPDETTIESLSCQQLLLLSSTGEIRKKTNIYTKHTEDIKCFAIKHYTSFCLIAEQRKEALETIQKQRTLLEQLGYMETCLLPLVKDNNNF